MDEQPGVCVGHDEPFTSIGIRGSRRYRTSSAAGGRTVIAAGSDAG
jgi:hypothetical protein